LADLCQQFLRSTAAVGVMEVEEVSMAAAVGPGVVLEEDSAVKVALVEALPICMADPDQLPRAGFGVRWDIKLFAASQTGLLLLLRMKMPFTGGALRIAVLPSIKADTFAIGTISSGIIGLSMGTSL
jgi:hypothetical protein